MSEVYVGTEIGNQNIRVVVNYIDPRNPTHKFPALYKTYGDGSVEQIEALTPDEARFIRDVLVEIFPL